MKKIFFCLLALSMVLCTHAQVWAPDMVKIIGKTSGKLETVNGSLYSVNFGGGLWTGEILECGQKPESEIWDLFQAYNADFDTLWNLKFASRVTPG